MTASRIGDLKMYVMLNELLPNHGLTSFGMQKKLFIFIFSACIIAIQGSIAFDYLAKFWSIRVLVTFRAFNFSIYFNI